MHSTYPLLNDEVEIYVCLFYVFIIAILNMLPINFFDL